MDEEVFFFGGGGGGGGEYVTVNFNSQQYMDMGRKIKNKHS